MKSLPCFSTRDLRKALERLSKRMPRDDALLLVARVVSNVAPHPRDVGRVLRFLEKEFRKELSTKEGVDYYRTLSKKMQAAYYLRNQSAKYLEYVKRRKKRVPEFSEFFRIEGEFADHLEKTRDPELIINDIESLVEKYLRSKDPVSAEAVVSVGRRVIFDKNHAYIPLLREALGMFLDEKAPVLYYTPEHILKHGKDREMEEIFNKIHELLGQGKRKKAEEIIYSLFQEKPIEKFEKLLSTMYHVAEKEAHKAETAYFIIDKALHHPNLVSSFAHHFLKDPDEVVRKLKSTASIIEIFPLGGVHHCETADILDRRVAERSIKYKEKLLDMIRVHLGYRPHW